MFRNVPLYVRIKEENNDFLTTLCLKAGVNKTDWVDKHLDYMRKNLVIRKAARLIEKENAAETRNKVQE